MLMDDDCCYITASFSSLYVIPVSYIYIYSMYIYARIDL